MVKNKAEGNILMSYVLGSGASYGLTGPASLHSLEPAYPHNDFKDAIGYPNGYYKESGAYSKRAAPDYWLKIKDPQNR